MVKNMRRHQFCPILFAYLTLVTCIAQDLGALFDGLQTAANHQQQNTNQQSNSNPVDEGINLGALFGGQNNQQQRFCP